MSVVKHNYQVRNSDFKREITVSSIRNMEDVRNINSRVASINPANDKGVLLRIESMLGLDKKLIRELDSRIQYIKILDPDHAGWEKLTLVPGDDGVFTSIAPKKDCADFRLRMSVVQ